MTLLLLTFFLILTLLAFIPVKICVIYSEPTGARIEIQPFCLVLKKEKKKKDNERKENKQSTARDVLYVLRQALPYSRVTIFKLDVSVFSNELFSLYRNTGLIWATLYPVLSYVGIYSKSMTIKDGALECAPTAEAQSNTSISLDVSFELAFYSVIRVIIDYFLFRKRRKKHARRN